MPLDKLPRRREGRNQEKEQLRHMCQPIKGTIEGARSMLGANADWLQQTSL
jgi:hypothetical protein